MKKLSKQQILEFHNSCLSAMHQCPNYGGRLVDCRINSTSILLSKINQEDVLEFWSNHRTLFGSGYNAYLTNEAYKLILLFRASEIKKELKSLETRNPKRIK